MSLEEAMDNFTRGRRRQQDQEDDGGHHGFPSLLDLFVDGAANFTVKPTKCVGGPDSSPPG